MEEFTNTNILKEKKKLTKNILIAILVIAVGVAMEVWAYYTIQKTEESAKPLNDIIIKEENKEDQIATLSVHRTPYQFAVQDGNPNSFYIVMDNDYMYIAYMSSDSYNLLNKADIKENPVEVKGVTKQTSKVIKELALEAYNEGLEEKDQLTMADFNSYFGSVYLDMTQANTEVAIIQRVLGITSLLLGIVLLIDFTIRKIRFSRDIKKMDKDMIEELDNEMNSQSAFYYEKAQLYLTEHYIINFKKMFKAIEYQDVIWMYSKVYRTNGAKTQQSIKIMTKNGKTYEIAAIDVVTKAKKEIYNEIWNTIVSKNNRMALGYTKEAAEKAQLLREEN